MHRCHGVAAEQAPLLGWVADRLSSVAVGSLPDRPFEHRVKVRLFEAEGDGWRPGDKVTAYNSFDPNQTR